MPAPSRTATPLPRSVRRPLVASVALIALVIGLIQAPAVSASSDRARLLRLVNSARQHRGLHSVRLDTDLSTDARAHTREMLRQDRLFDPPDLRRMLAPYPWNTVGAAAVGCADSLNELHRAFMHSDVHRSILLDPRVRWVGIGVIRTDNPNRCGRGSIWDTDVFYG